MSMQPKLASAAWTLAPALITAMIAVLINLGSAQAVHAVQGHKHHGAFAACAKACADCQLQCDSCFEHCAGLVEGGQKDHAASMHTCIDCAECCGLAAHLTARSSSFAHHACDCCAKCCDECAAACAKFPDDEHMAACAKSCQDCAKACREMLEHLK
jgi:hypothetical protein